MSTDPGEGAGPPDGPPGMPPPAPTTDRERLVNRVVVVRQDGTRLRGFVYDVNPERGNFHLYATEDAAETAAELVQLADLKCVAFVKSFAGNPNYRENKTEFTGRVRWGRPYEVVFGDGERMVGVVETYHPKKLGFYLIPPDPRSNSLRIFVVKANARSVQPLVEKTGEGKDGVWEAPDPVAYPVEKRNQLVIRLLRDPDAKALSREVFLAPQILNYWKDTFLEAGRMALTDPAIADSHAPERRFDLVQRLFAKEDEAVVSQTFLVPFKILADWRERFLDAGERALRAQAGDEGATAPEVLKERYAAMALVEEEEPGGGDSFLDSLEDLLDDLPGGKAPGA